MAEARIRRSGLPGPGAAALLIALTLAGCTEIVVTAADVVTLRINPRSVELVAGDTARLSVTVHDASGNELSGRTVAWSSSEPDVAVVDAGGLVRAVGAGRASIRADREGVLDSARVSVEAPPPPAKPEAPAAPRRLRITNTAAKMIDLAWDHDGRGVAVYRLDRQRGGGSYAQAAVINAPATSHRDRNLRKGTVYHYRLRACTAAGLCSAYSNDVSGRTRGN